MKPKLIFNELIRVNVLKNTNTSSEIMGLFETKTGKWIVLRRINSYLVIYCLNLMLNVKLFGAEFIIIALQS